MKPRELKINDIVYAKYEIRKEILFMKVIKNIVDDEIDSETVLCNIISLIEKKEFKLLSYLNIR